MGLSGLETALSAAAGFDPAVIGADPDAYLSRSEAMTGSVTRGEEKEIVWADSAKRARTALSLVYVHGYDAAKEELRPLPDIVARHFGANLFFTRLTGHGQDRRALAKGSLAAWMRDYSEALAIGRRVGDHVVVLGNSTGASLATIAAAQPRGGKDIAAYVLTSPNFGLTAPAGLALGSVWGSGLLGRLAEGVSGMVPSDRLSEKLFAGIYVAAGAVPAVEAAELARLSPVETIRTPALFVFSERDKVVRADMTRKLAARWGGKHELLVVAGSEDPASHRLAGDEKSPSTTRGLAEKIIAWLGRVEF